MNNDSIFLGNTLISEIQTFVENSGCSWIEDIMIITERKGLEIESVGELILNNSFIMNEVSQEANKLNLLKQKNTQLSFEE